MVRKTQIFIAILLFLMILPAGFAAAQYSSPNYSVSETFFGAGGNLENSSTNYKAKTAAGELAVGNISSPSFQAQAGFNTSDRIILEVNVVGGIHDLGTLTTANAAATTTTFTIRDYLSDGYTVQVVGNPPNNNGHIIQNMASSGSSVPGTEQFGVNLAANNLATVGPFGATPAQIPDATFGFGYALSPYDTTNVFKYVDGDTIARSDKSSGITSYTLSMITNISKTTAGGAYGTSMYVRAVPTY